jgi:hypothetical protein
MLCIELFTPGRIAAFALSPKPSWSTTALDDIPPTVAAFFAMARSLARVAAASFCAAIVHILFGKHRHAGLGIILKDGGKPALAIDGDHLVELQPLPLLMPHGIPLLTAGAGKTGSSV